MKASLTTRFQSITQLPPALGALYPIFLAYPALSLLSGHIAGPSGAGIWGEILAVSTYWILPLSLCSALFGNRPWLLSAYVAHCGFSIVLLLWGDFSPGMDRRALYGLMVFSMVYIAFLFRSKNLLYPMLTRDPSLWRRSDRYEIGGNVSILLGEREFKAVLLDCSATGMALLLPEEDYRQYFKGRQETPFMVVIPPAGEHRRFPMRLPTKFIWGADTKTGQVKLGCKGLDVSLYKSYLASEPLKKKSQLRLSDMGDDSKLEQDIRQSALMLWLVCLALALLLPIS